MKLVNYRCPECGENLEWIYQDTEPVASHVPCRCKRDAWAIKRNWKDNPQRVRIFDKPQRGE